MPVLTEKAALRRQLLAARQALDPGQRAAAAREVARQVAALPEFVQAKTVLLYLSTPQELDTAPILREALRRGKQVGAPRCEGEGQMRFYVYRPGALIKGAFGIREPDPARCPPVEGLAESICLAPGLSYDRAGFRLGYGGGYYDRFFAGYPGFRIGVCFAALLRQALPIEPTDCPVQLVVTEKGGFRL